MIGECRCGNAFNVTRKSRIYCSKRCKIRYYMQDRRAGVRVVGQCMECHMRMTVRMSAYYQRYCSSKCRLRAWRKRAAA